MAAAYAAQEREAEVVPFLHDMEQRLAAADLVLCRAGATTCAELAVAGKASVLVPFAAAADDHQRKNAAAMQSAFLENGLQCRTFILPVDRQGVQVSVVEG
mgnify:CR=1 FL=1